MILVLEDSGILSGKSLQPTKHDNTLDWKE